MIGQGHCIVAIHCGNNAKAMSSTDICTCPFSHGELQSGLEEEFHAANEGQA